MSIFDKLKKHDKPEAEKKPVVVEVADNSADVKVTAVEKKSTVRTAGLNAENLSGILVRPIVTEKSANLAQNNQYVFEVSVKANKIQIAQAIELKYGVKPIKVNITKRLGKTVRSGRNTGKTKDRKKAVVMLPEGKSIQVHEGV